MKVILTEDVENLGGSHEVVEVADGYARNYLMPRSLAMPATKSAMANLDNMKRVQERRQAKLRGGAEETASRLQGQTLVIPARTGSAGRLYGSIGTADIANQLKESLGIELDRKQIQLSEPIRSTGVYPVPVTLHRDVKVQLMVQVGDVPAGTAPAGGADGSSGDGAATNVDATTDTAVAEGHPS
ncbi:MAG: 50S ribosomal protein L9 [Abitibacteriaceae bacterium]|nr:50S ribosomal protein L9 [Abditibacteriaceae bacterium]